MTWRWAFGLPVSVFCLFTVPLNVHHATLQKWCKWTLVQPHTFSHTVTTRLVLQWGSCWSNQFAARDHIAHLQQHCHNSKSVNFLERLLNVLKCYNFLWMQWRHNCCPVASFADCVTTLYLLKVHLQMFLSIPITQKCQILSCDTRVVNERYIPTPGDKIRDAVCTVI